MAIQGSKDTLLVALKGSQDSLCCGIQGIRGQFAGGIKEVWGHTLRALKGFEDTLHWWHWKGPGTHFLWHWRGLRTHFAGGIYEIQGHIFLVALEKSKDTLCWRNLRIWGHTLCVIKRVWGHTLCGINRIQGHTLCGIKRVWGHTFLVAFRGSEDTFLVALKASKDTFGVALKTSKDTFCWCHWGLRTHLSVSPKGPGTLVQLWCDLHIIPVLSKAREQLLWHRAGGCPSPQWPHWVT